MTGDSWGPAVSGGEEAYRWFAAGMGTIANNIAVLLAALGVGSGAVVIAWLLAGGLVIGGAVKFKAVLFYGFIFVTVFVIAAGLGVKLGG